MATIVVTKEPVLVEVAYGPIVVTTNNTDTDEVTHAIKIYDVNSDTLAFLRQSPNQAGYCHFDISKILQRQLTFDKELETTGTITILNIGEDEVLEYKIGYGYIDNITGNYVEADTLDYKRVFYGRKEYYTLDWDKTPYIPSMSYSPPENFIEQKGRFLSDRTYDYADASELPGHVPPRVEGRVWRLTRRKNEDLTISILNQLTGSYAPVGYGLGGFFIDLVNSNNGKFYTAFTRNILAQGGGPSPSINNQIAPTGSYTIITYAGGISNPQIALNEDDIAYYYITPFSYQYDDPGSSPGNVYPWEAIRVDIDNSNCAPDYTPIQFSWVNSFGVKDYFSFEKRNEKTTTVTRNTYRKPLPGWNSATYNPLQADRGESTYSVEANDVYEASTKYLTKDEMDYLRNLIVSPEVKVKFEGTTEWVPVVLETNRWVERKHIKDGAFQLQVRFRLANKNLIQNG